jgi:hypothetical protein
VFHATIAAMETSCRQGSGVWSAVSKRSRDPDLRLVRNRLCDRSAACQRLSAPEQAGLNWRRKLPSPKSITRYTGIFTAPRKLDKND